jgi:hypothetical protein
MKESAAFEQTYQHYLSEIKKIDYLERADRLGVEIKDEKLIIPLYDREYTVSASEVDGPDGEVVTPAVRVILCKYILMCPDELPVLSRKLMTYREFRDAGPLVSYFTTNTNKTIESQFSGKVDLLQEIGKRVGGTIEKNESYDLSLLFYALPRIPVILNFNDHDDMFPAACSILYQESAQQFLDMECLAMTGTLLIGKLLRN